MATGQTVCMVQEGPHSDDIVRVFHGMPNAAIGCGYHANNFPELLYAAHREFEERWA